LIGQQAKNELNPSLGGFDRSGVCGHGFIGRIRAGHNGDQGLIEPHFRKD